MSMMTVMKNRRDVLYNPEWESADDILAFTIDSFGDGVILVENVTVENIRGTLGSLMIQATAEPSSCTCSVDNGRFSVCLDGVRLTHGLLRYTTVMLWLVEHHQTRRVQSSIQTTVRTTETLFTGNHKSNHFKSDIVGFCIDGSMNRMFRNILHQESIRRKLWKKH